MITVHLSLLLPSGLDFKFFKHYILDLNLGETGVNLESLPVAPLGSGTGMIQDVSSTLWTFLTFVTGSPVYFRFYFYMASVESRPADLHAL